MGLPGVSPNRARRCGRYFLVSGTEHLADRASLGGSGRTHVDRTLRSTTTASGLHLKGHAWFGASNRGLSSCPAGGRMHPKMASCIGTMTHRRHQRESQVCIFLNRIPT